MKVGDLVRRTVLLLDIEGYGMIVEVNGKSKLGDGSKHIVKVYWPSVSRILSISEELLELVSESG